MKPSQQNLSRTLGVARRLIAKAAAGTNTRAQVAYIHDRWPAYTKELSPLVTKAAIGGVESGTPDTMHAQIVSAVRNAEVFGRLPGRVPARLGVGFNPASGLTATITGAGKAVPVSKQNLDSIVLLQSYFRIAGLTVASKEALQTEEMERGLGANLVIAAANASDSVFLSTSGVGILNGATEVAVHGNTPALLKASFADLLSQLTGLNPATTRIVMNPWTAFYGGLLIDDNGVIAFPTLGMQGGDIGGIGVITSAACPTSIIAVIDGSSLVTADGGASFSVSEQASIEMDTAPAMDGTASPPVGPSGAVISLFQNDLVAFKAERHVAWASIRNLAAGYISGVDLQAGVEAATA